MMHPALKTFFHDLHFRVFELIHAVKYLLGIPLSLKTVLHTNVSSIGLVMIKHNRPISHLYKMPRRKCHQNQSNNMSSLTFS